MYALSLGSFGWSDYTVGLFQKLSITREEKSTQMEGMERRREKSDSPGIKSVVENRGEAIGRRY